MKRAIITKEDIRQFIYDAICDFGNNKVVNRDGFCEMFNCSYYQLNKYLAMGMPWTGKPTRKKFDVNKCRKWFDANRREIT